MKKQKKQKPNYVVDKYGMMYDENKVLSEHDKTKLKQLLEMLKKK